MRNFIRIFSSFRMLVIFFLGFASGFPFALTGSTLQAWMKDEQVDIQKIGLFGLLTLPYALKFLWAPLVDLYVPFLGRRKGWILIFQILTCVSIFGMSFSEPSEQLSDLKMLGLILTTLLVAFGSASQDIVIDAYRVELTHVEERGLAASIHVLGYRLALIISGAYALRLSDHIQWQQVYQMMGVIFLFLILITVFAPEPKTTLCHFPKNIKEAVLFPIKQFFADKSLWIGMQILVFITIYKLDIVMAEAFQTVFLKTVGYSDTQIGNVTKVFGLVSTIVGGIVGGIWMTRLNLKPALWIFGLIQASAGICFVLLSHFGDPNRFLTIGAWHLSDPLFILSMTVEKFCTGMGTTAFTVFLMRICDARYTATQYALFSSLFAFSKSAFVPGMAFVQNAVGWSSYFLLSIVAAVPGLLLLTQFSKWVKEPSITSTNS